MSDDRNQGIVQFDVAQEQWAAMNVQNQMVYVIQSLITFLPTPAFHIMSGFRMSVKQNGIILPMHVPLALGKQPEGVRLGRD